MIDPKNQIIYIKGKRVEFDSLPLNLQENLLTLWKVKLQNDGTETRRKKTSTKEKANTKEKSS